MSELRTPLDSAREYALYDKAENTIKAYRSDLIGFAAWCGDRGLGFLPASPETTAGFLASLADRGFKASSITRKAAAIRYAHRMKGLEPPTNVEAVKAVLRGIRRKLGTAPTRKAPATADAIADMIAKLPDTLAGKRDRALLLLGFAAALRRSEIVALDVMDLERSAEGVRVHIRRSKTDQEGAGDNIAVPRGTKLRPLQAIDAWLEASGIVEGPLFRRVFNGSVTGADRLAPRAVARIVKRCAALAGYDPEIFAGHSLRAGFVTSALDAGADILKVMDVTRHREVRTLKVYDRRARGFRNHAGREFL